jgi:ribosomal protein S18 acetylase RimI-like enzyme
LDECGGCSRGSLKSHRKLDFKLGHYRKFLSGREGEEGEAEVTLEIRKASTEDAGAIVEVFDHAPFLKDCYRGEAGISLVENKLDTIWLADLDGRVASVMIVLRKDDFGGLEISLIVTKPEFQRRGFARDLIHKAKWIAADWNSI